MSPLIRAAIKSFPVVVISGARQVGKSTFLLQEFQDFKFISLDDLAVVEQAITDPPSLWTDANQIIIDEAQKVPDLFNAIKLSVDRTRGATRFLVSGSSNLLLMKGISESLAGRAVYFEMLPMTYGEIAAKTDSPKNFFELWKTNLSIKEGELEPLSPIPLMLKGFMPSLLYLGERRDVLLWWEVYVKTYLERDLREISQIKSLIDFKKVIDSLALRTANILNQTEIASSIGVSQPTVYRYIKLLEVSNLVKRVPAYFPSKKKRLVKSPKIFFIDPGLSVFLAGYHDEASLKTAREIGSFFETVAFLHLKVLAELMIPKATIFSWRTATGKEVNFILEHGKKLLAFEVKLTKNPTLKEAKNLLGFIEEYSSAVRGILLHAGSSVKWLHSKIIALPWWWITI